MSSRTGVVVSRSVRGFAIANQHKISCVVIIFLSFTFRTLLLFLNGERKFKKAKLNFQKGYKLFDPPSLSCPHSGPIRLQHKISQIYYTTQHNKNYNTYQMMSERCLIPYVIHPVWDWNVIANLARLIEELCHMKLGFLTLFASPLCSISQTNPCN